MTALVVRYMDGRAARMVHDEAPDDASDVVIVYEEDTISAAVTWLFEERSFVRCARAEAVAEVVLVTVPAPEDPADLEASLQVAAMSATVSWGYVRCRSAQAA